MFRTVLEAERHECICIDDSVYEVRTALNHTLVDELLERLLLAYITEVEEELVPETGVNQVARSVLSTTDIEVNVTPVFISLAAYEGLIVVRVHISEIVCGASRKTRHCAQFDRITFVCPVSSTAQRRFA